MAKDTISLNFIEKKNNKEEYCGLEIMSYSVALVAYSENLIKLTRGGSNGDSGGPKKRDKNGH